MAATRRMDEVKRDFGSLEGGLGYSTACRTTAGNANGGQFAGQAAEVHRRQGRSDGSSWITYVEASFLIGTERSSCSSRKA
jgi:hypothetical protein